MSHYIIRIWLIYSYIFFFPSGISPRSCRSFNLSRRIYRARRDRSRRLYFCLPNPSKAYCCIDFQSSVHALPYTSSPYVYIDILFPPSGGTRARLFQHVYYSWTERRQSRSGYFCSREERTVGSWCGDRRKTARLN